jgi:3-hydroxybutyryl-CoA dehydrogenase
MNGTEVKQVAVLGMGTMGAGIAQVCGAAGLDVVVLEATEERFREGCARMDRFLQEGVRRGKVTADERDAVLGRVTGTTSAQDVGGSELVIEAVVEDLEVKRDVLRVVGAAVTDETVIATNTSALSVTTLAACVPHPERFGGLHFFNPAPLMRLVEVVAATQTSQDTCEALEAFAGLIGKEAVVTKDRPGFLVNRLLMPYLNQAVQDYDDGLAKADDLDAAVELGLGYPMGPLKLLDLIGLDNHLHATQAAWEQTRDAHLVPPPLLERLVDAGRLGRKAGQGFRAHE